MFRRPFGASRSIKQRHAWYLIIPMRVTLPYCSMGSCVGSIKTIGVVTRGYCVYTRVGVTMTLDAISTSIPLASMKHHNCYSGKGCRVSSDACRWDRIRLCKIRSSIFAKQTIKFLLSSSKLSSISQRYSTSLLLK